MLGHKDIERHFSSGDNIEEIGHESNLSATVAFPDSFNLSLPDHVHDLIPTDGPPRRLEIAVKNGGSYVLLLINATILGILPRNGPDCL